MRRSLLVLLLALCTLTAGWLLFDFIRQVGWDLAWRFLLGMTLLLVIVGALAWMITPKSP